MEKQASYREEQIEKRYKYIKIYSLLFFSLAILRIITVILSAIQTEDKFQRDLMKSLIILGVTTLLLYFTSHSILTHKIQGNFTKYLDIPLSIILFLAQFVMFGRIKEVENDFDRGILMVIPIIVCLNFFMFIFRSLILSIMGQILLIIFFVFDYPSKSIATAGRLSIGCSLMMIAIYIYLRENKLNYDLRQRLKKKEALYKEFMDLLKDSVVILSSRDGLIYQNPASKQGDLQVTPLSWAENYSKITQIGHKDNTLLDYVGLLIEGANLKNRPLEDLSPVGRIIRDNEQAFYENEFEILSEEQDINILNITLLVSNLFQQNNMAIIIKDITEKKKYESEIIGKKYKTIIFNSLSHEIRTPLNGIVGMIQLSKDEIQSPQALQNLSIAESNCFFLQNQLNDIIDFGQHTCNHFMLQISRFKIRDLLQQLAVIVKPLIGGLRPIEFRIELESNVPEYAHLDEQRITQILTNFLSNALKFTQTGQISLICRYKSVKKKLFLGVSDTGRGIPRENINELFEMKKLEAFSSENSSSTHLSGMGLTISQMICSNMGSKIKVRSNPFGSLFYFSTTLTFAREFKRNSRVSDGTVTPETHSVEPHSRAIPTFSSFAHITQRDYSHNLILIVDDSSTNRFVLKGMLKEFKTYIKVKEAVDGLEALNMVKQANKDGFEDILIFMDLDMPIMDGMTSIRKIRSLENLANVAIIIVTAFTTEVHQKEAEKIGIQDFFKKPVSKGKITTAVNRYLLKKYK